MINIIKNIKNEIYFNGTLQWKALLFFITEPIALAAVYYIIERGKLSVKHPETFAMSTFYTVLFTFLAFVMRILYQLDKPTALLFVILNTIVWSYCLYIWIIALIKNKKSKVNNNKSNKK